MNSENWLIIASGESARETMFNAPFDKVRNYKIMTINSSWQLAPFADVHYSNDGDWFENEIRHQGMALLAGGEMYCGDPLRNVPGTNRDYLFDKKMRGLTKQRGKLAWGGNSGYAGINMATQLGAKKILLVGYDMCGKSHWHGDHDAKVRKDFNFPMWIPRFNELYFCASVEDVEIRNASPISALKCFPKVDILEGLKWLGE
jgi:hypothetical protein